MQPNDPFNWRQQLRRDEERADLIAMVISIIVIALILGIVLAIGHH